jgi:hypothetical protein
MPPCSPSFITLPAPHGGLDECFAQTGEAQPWHVVALKHTHRRADRGVKTFLGNTCLRLMMYASVSNDEAVRSRVGRRGRVRR